MPLLHPFDFKESGDLRGRFTLSEFESLLSWLVTQPDICLTTCSAAAKIGRYDAVRFAQQRKYLLWSLKNWGLPSWAKRFPRTQYLETKTAARLRRRMIFEIFACYAVACIVSAIGASFAREYLVVPKDALRWGATFLTVAATVFTFVRRTPVYFYGTLCLTFLAGFTTGAWVAR